jgi:hypothetical protein
MRWWFWLLCIWSRWFLIDFVRWANNFIYSQMILFIQQMILFIQYLILFDQLVILFVQEIILFI